MDPNKKKQLKNDYKSKPAVGGIYQITCSGNQRALIKSTLDMAGIQSRYKFAMAIKSCPDPALQSEWLAYGTDSFSFSILEELSMKEGQTVREFSDDMETLLALWLEKSGSNAPA